MAHSQAFRILKPLSARPSLRLLSFLSLRKKLSSELFPPEAHSIFPLMPGFGILQHPLRWRPVARHTQFPAFKMNRQLPDGNPPATVATSRGLFCNSPTASSTNGI